MRLTDVHHAAIQTPGAPGPSVMTLHIKKERAEEHRQKRADLPWLDGLVSSLTVFSDHLSLAVWTQSSRIAIPTHVGQCHSSVCRGRSGTGAGRGFQSGSAF